MSGIQNSDFLNSDDAVFEYVAGTLEGEQRVQFEKLMREDESIQLKILAWEERLVYLNSANSTREPTKNNWPIIEKRINANRQLSEQTEANLFVRLFWLPWLLTGALSVLLMLNSNLLPSNLDDVEKDLPIDYVAVMTTADGTAALSTVAKGENKLMWLHWQEQKITDEQNYQLWAVSKSDGETRSISVIANSNTELLELSEAEWRLIKDADSLLLTIEEVGGSPIDEPSDQLVAKGLCVRLTRTNLDA